MSQQDSQGVSSAVPSLYRWRFGAAEFDEARLELRVAGLAVDVEQKPLQVLALLLRHAGEVVTKRELFDNVWAGRVTVDHVLATAVGKLRKALGEDGEPLIVTVPRVGYRLAGPVERVAVGRRLLSSLHLKAGDTVPGRAHFVLERQLGPAHGSEVWLARHRKTREPRVYKFSPSGERLSSLKREATLSRVLRESLGSRSDFVRVLDWNFEQAPFYLECEYGGVNLIEWAGTDGPLATMPRADRLDLFLAICEAVAAAHSVGVLHKDLKPANVLMEARDGGYVMRLTDFGSSRLLEPERLAELGITELGLTMTQGVSAESTSGTPLYLAPELLAGAAPTVKSDVYALGLILYQLLVGDLKKPMVSGWERDIDDELLREDLSLATDGEPARRLSGVRELSDRIRSLGERRAQRLERARERDSARRAEEALQRARLRRPWVVATVAALSLGLSGVLWLYLMAEHARALAERQADRAEALNRFWTREVIDSGNPYSGPDGADTAIATVLERAGRNAAGAFAEHPDTAATVYEALGDAYTGMDRYLSAAQAYLQAEQTYLAAAGGDSPPVWRARFKRGRAHVYASEFEQAGRLLDVPPSRWPDYPEPIRFVLVEAQAALQDQLQDWSRAAELYEAAVDLLPASGLGAGQQLAVEHHLADVYQRLGRLDESEAIAQKLVRRAEADPGISRARLASLRVMLGSVLVDRERYDEAEPLLLQAYDDIVDTLGAETHDAASAANLLSILYYSQARYEASSQYMQRAYDAVSVRLGEAHQTTLLLRLNLGVMMLTAGRTGEAAGTLSELAGALAQQNGPGSPFANLARYYLTQALILERQFPQAREQLGTLDPQALDQAEPGFDAAARLAVLAVLSRDAGSHSPDTRRWLESRRRDFGECHCQLPRTIDAVLARLE